MILLRSLFALVPWQAWALAAVLVAGGAFHLYALNAAYKRWEADALKSATIEAGKRIAAMEKTNADFRALSPRDRCRAFMRDSGLPERHCD